MRAAGIIAFLFYACTALASEFDRPWHSPETAFIIDAYHGNSIDWDQLATEPRVVAVIHKATVGSNTTDPKYHARKREAQKRGYLWGSYHMGIAGNPEKQADHYLNTVKPGANELIALDLEALDSRKFMNAGEAIRFINRVKQRLGRYPVVYVNHRSARIISQKFQNTVFAHTPLWYAHFTDSVDNFPTGVWPSYTLWQFSSEILFQQGIPGTKPDMDVNVFNGSKNDLRARWPFVKSTSGKTRTASAAKR